MNFVRRRPVGGNERGTNSGVSPECAHLSRLFHQYKDIHDANEQEQMFYELLPVFHGVNCVCPYIFQVLSSCKPFEFIEKFPDIHGFCSRATQILVGEIKRRAANQTSEEGSSKIAIYLEPSQEVPTCITGDKDPSRQSLLAVDNKGWNLLLCLNLLSTGPTSLIECMVAASLPSTMVKCTYIFLDLPNASGSTKVTTFHPVFKQLLQRLSVYPIAAEEMARKDALCHLFNASADWCSLQNVIWRSTIASVLSTVAQNGLTPQVVRYIHDSKCIPECLKVISQGRLAPLEIFNSFVALLHVLRESAVVSQVLLDDFRLHSGFLTTTELVLKLEQDVGQVETQQALQTIISLMERLVVCGPVELRPKPGAGEQIHTISGFKVQLPKSGAQKSVRNVYAFGVLQGLFLSASTTDLSLLVLNTIRTIYLQDLANYFILESQNTLVLFAKKIYQKSIEVQDAFFSLLESLVSKLLYVPMREISSIVVLLRACNFNQSMALTLRHLSRLLVDHHIFKDVYHDVGLLELVIECLRRFTDLVRPPEQESSTAPVCSAPAPNSPRSVIYEVGQLLLDFLRQCVQGSPNNTDMCIQSGAADFIIQHLLSLSQLPNAARWRRHSLAVLEELLLTSGGEELIPSLLTKMHSTFVELKIDILRSCCRVLRESHRCRVVFRKVTGFVYVMQELVYLENSLRVPHSPKSQSDSTTLADGCIDPTQPMTQSTYLTQLTYEQIFKLVKALFTTFGIAMKFEPANAHYFATEIQFSILTDRILALGSFIPTSESATTATVASQSASGTEEAANVPTSSPVESNVFDAFFRNANETELLLARADGSDSSNVIRLRRPEAVTGSIDEPGELRIVPKRLIECCLLARYVYDLAVDAYDKRSLDKRQYDSPSEPNPANAQVLQTHPSIDERSQSVDSTYTTSHCPHIVHPGAVICMLHLTAALDPKPTNSSDEGTLHATLETWKQAIIDLQTCLLDVIMDLFRSERNQQVMCTAQMPQEMLTLLRHHIVLETSQLHNRVQAMFECLVLQSLSPMDLREFLRISNPLSCPVTDFIKPSTDSLQEPASEFRLALVNARARSGGPLPLSQIKCLIATSTPVQAQMARPVMNSTADGGSTHNDMLDSIDAVMSCITVPPFVEFDMGPEGFGCLFLPSIAPQGLTTVSHLSGIESSAEMDAMRAVPPTVEGAASMGGGGSGGLGVGERPFPPPHGLTFSSWVCVVRFDRVPSTSAEAPTVSSSSAQSRHGPSPTRVVGPTPQAAHLLTIVRGIQSVNDQLTCLSIYIHPHSRMLVVSTRERFTQSDHGDSSDHLLSSSNNSKSAGSYNKDDQCNGPNGAQSASDAMISSTNSCAIFPCGLPNSSDTQQWPVGVWRHLAVVFNRAGMIKSSSCSVYLDGQLVGMQRLTYLGSTSASSGFLGRQAMPSSVCAFVGTPAADRRPSCLVWRQGPMHLMEEPLNANRIAYMARLGPNYMGSFQSPPPISHHLATQPEEPYYPLFSEDKLVFGIYASTLSTFTVSRIRKIYNLIDAKAIARQFHISPKDNTTPVRLLHNSAAHLQGPARPLGAVLVGYQGVRAFTPSPVTRQLHCVGGGSGGIRIGLALIAMATDVETLYAATKAACTLIKCSPAMAVHEMRAARGYQIFAMLLRKKRHLLTTRIFDCILSLALNMDAWTDVVGSVEAYSALNHPAFEDLICDLDLWRVQRDVPYHPQHEANTLGRTPFMAIDPESEVSSSVGLVTEEDYRLVANLINHLVELLAVPEVRQTRSVTVYDVTTSDHSTQSGKVTKSLHPIWTAVFDRLLYLLMNAHSTHVSACCRPPLLMFAGNTNSIQTLVTGRSALVEAAMHFIHAYVSRAASGRALLRFGQFMSWTLPPSDVDEKDVHIDQVSLNNELHSAEMFEWREHLILLRNACFDTLVQLITDGGSLHTRLCNLLVSTLGFDWFHLFLRPAIHASSVTRAFHLLVLTMLNPGYAVNRDTPLDDWSNGFRGTTHQVPKSHAAQTKSVPTDAVRLPPAAIPNASILETDGVTAYRDGCPAGRWLRGCELLLKRQHGLLLDNPNSTRRSSTRFLMAVRSFQLEACQQSGFIALKALLPSHAGVPHLFYLLTALLLRIPIRHVPQNFETLDAQTWMDQLKMEFDTLCDLISQRKASVSSVDGLDINEKSTTSNVSSVSAAAASPPASTGVGGLMSSFLSGAGFGRKRVRDSVVSEVSETDTADFPSSSAMWGAKAKPSLCPEAATLLLQMVRLLVSNDMKTAIPSDFRSSITKEDAWHWSENYSEVTLQFLQFLYRSQPTFRPLVMSVDFIGGLVAILGASSRLSLVEWDMNARTDASYTQLPNPVPQLAMQFLRTIITDSLSLSPAAHQPVHIFDVLLESGSDQLSSKQYIDLQTDILKNLIHHLMTTNCLLNRLSVVGPSDASFTQAHLVYCCARIVDKMWQGYFSGAMVHITDFLLYLLANWPNRRIDGDVLSLSLSDSLYRSLNRTVLYRLSRPILTRDDQEQVLNLFTRFLSSSSSSVGNQHVMSENQRHPYANNRRSLILDADYSTLQQTSVLFNPDNADPEFPVCLIHLLMQLVRTDRYNPGISQPSRPPPIDPAISETASTTSSTGDARNYYRTTFYDEELDTGEDASQSVAKPCVEVIHSEPIDLNEPDADLFDAINEAALHLWNECYLAKKLLIANLAPDTALVSGLSVPSLTDWTSILEAPCLVTWAAHVDSEAAGTGGIGGPGTGSIPGTTCWGRISGPPSSSEQSLLPQLPTPPVQAKASVSSTTSSGLHHQLSMRLSRLPGQVFRLGSSVSSSNNNNAAGSAMDNSTTQSTPTHSANGTNGTPQSAGFANRPYTTPFSGLSQGKLLEMAKEAINTAVPNQLVHLRELVEQQRKQHYRNIAVIQRQLELEWDKIELELTRQRGLWGRISPDPLVRWKLDPTEGPCRMRKRMLPHPSFYARYPYQPVLPRSGPFFRSSSPVPGTMKQRNPRSRFSRLHLLNFQPCGILHQDWGPLAHRPLGMQLHQTHYSGSTLSPLITESPLPELEHSPTGVPESLHISGELNEPDATTLQTLRQSLDPEDLEQSLHQTASILRSSGKSPHGDRGLAMRATDDLDEILAIPELEDDNEDSSGSSVKLPDSPSNHPVDESESLDASPSVSTTSVEPMEPKQQRPTSLEVTSSIVVPVSSYASAVLDVGSGSGDHDQQVASHEAILRLLEPGERPTVMYRCARILGLDVYEGLLLFGRGHFYVIDGYTLINTQEIVDIDSLPPDVVHEPVVPCTATTTSHQAPHGTGLTGAPRSNWTDLWSSGAVSQTSGRQFFKFPYENIKDVHKRRYLLQPIALEVFNSDGRNFLLVFSKGLQNKAYQRTPGLLSSLLGEKTVTQRWERGELSNFQYLMYLNTLAGRSYNDLMQYPIFPWVLSDYDSNELDLSRPETFRDFSKPMGAQTSRRFSQYHRRFREWDDPTGETPPYHYGTHYSSAMIVASYLVRMEPFTQQFLKLQGGQFDLPDRMFHSVKDAWISASQHNMADVRELIPEFFYLPDFLTNSNQFELGSKQSGQEVDHVVLPPWARNDPREFIRAHREALESEYVSAHLHEWIDLIFGYKQKGDTAVQAGNVFHHLFYEGNVDIYSIDDPLKRSAVIGFINNFGQIPKQLFRKPHPSRRIAVTRPLPAGVRRTGSQVAVDLFYRNLECLRPCLQPLKELRHAVGQIVQLDSQTASLTGASGNSNAAHSPIASEPSQSNVPASQSTSPSSLNPASIVAVEQHKCLLPPSNTTYVAWGFTDGSLRLGSVFDPLERARCVFEMADPEEIFCCAVPNKRTLITAGMSTVVRVWWIQTFDRTLTNPPGSTTTSSASDNRPVSSPPTGHNMSSSTTAAAAANNSNSPSTSNNPSASRYFLQSRAVLCGHTEAVTCLAASNAFNLVVSGSRDRTCILWDLTRLSFLRQLVGHVAPVAAVCISEASGDIATCAGSFLHVWNCNGEPIVSVDTQIGHGKQILCVCMSTLYDWDADNVILTGGSDGVVRMWRMEHAQIKADTNDANPVTISIDNQTSHSPIIMEASKTNESLRVSVPTSPSPNAKLSLVTSFNPADASSQPTWSRQLVCRGKLTMHTAYARADNSAPAQVTALAISRDHRSILVGDSRGRVHAWSVPPEAFRGGMTDQWVRDEDATNCAADGCGARFSLTERKHHCRNCGKVFCSKCSRSEIEIYRLRLFKPVRVCQSCYNVLLHIQAPRRQPRTSESPLSDRDTTR